MLFRSSYCLKICIDDDTEGESDAVLDKMEHVGMLMYVIGSQQKQLRSLVRNAPEYSRKCDNLSVRHEFKNNPTLKTLKNWWVSETATVKTQTTVLTPTARKNLIADLGSESESDQASKKSKKKRYNRKFCHRLPPHRVTKNLLHRRKRLVKKEKILSSN